MKSGTTSNMLTHIRTAHCDTIKKSTDSTSKAAPKVPKVLQKVKNKGCAKNSPVWKPCTVSHGKNGTLIRTVGGGQAETR